MPLYFALTHQLASPRAVLPNPSLERTRTGMTPCPRVFVFYHRPRDQGTTPALSAQLKR
jgi:hypothetical protein